MIKKRVLARAGQADVSHLLKLVLEAVVGAAFGQRRKTLRNTLRSYLNEADFEKLNINAQLRAENLAVAEFTKVANYLDKPQPDN